MTKRIFRSILFAAVTAVILVSVLIMGILYRSHENSIISGLKSEAAFLIRSLSRQTDEAGFLTGLYSNNRITLIAADGMVLYDNRTDAVDMDNHSTRPEVIDALKSGTGQSNRYSDTLSEKTIYYAIKSDAGNVLRLAATQSSIMGMLWSIAPAFALIILAVALLSLMLARYMSRHIVAPINAIDLDAPFSSEAYDELSPLLLRIARQKENLNIIIRELTEKQKEFEAVASNMREGLILLSGTGNIISINKSAAGIFDADIDECSGKNILAVNRSVAMHSVIEGVQKGKSAEAMLKIKNKFYQLLASHVSSEDGSDGSVILILDVTDRHSAEISRREFTANVSHELKTPLTSILGYAEIMKNGVAKPGDMKDFAGRIHDEAGRLIALVEDILRLSQLDEKVKLPEKEQVDLFALARDVSRRLGALAEKTKISLEVRGEHVVIPGISKILDEMIYNLCDNAIKYNVSGGSVVVEVIKIDGKPRITVSDTGIGIPAEHHEHVFERFYRVDKSHSKDTGGTGLGLSIVKHGAAIHGAEIALESNENVGTSIRITFPGV